MRWFTLLLAAACTYAVNGSTFRTQESATAFERAVAAVAQHCHGVRDVNAEAGIVTSRWQVYHSREGAYLGRCQVSVWKADDEAGAEVRVAVTTKKCPLVDLEDLDALGASPTCEVTFSMPGEVATGQSLAVQHIETDVRR
ncbi:MAG: hypothetical protein MUC96_21985 [Myxococcaceae bacterium]|jgi:hypothetical protein|nr:hypothetical protein [Myxococcaceae bacterium]